jgi:hypothetical protein
MCMCVYMPPVKDMRDEESEDTVHMVCLTCLVAAFKKKPIVKLQELPVGCQPWSLL